MTVNSIYVTIKTLSFEHDQENEKYVQYEFGGWRGGVNIPQRACNSTHTEKKSTSRQLSTQLRDAKINTKIISSGEGRQCGKKTAFNNKSQITWL